MALIDFILNLAALLLWLFRRSLERGMIAGAVEQLHPGTRASAADAVPTNSAVAPLRIQVIDPGVSARSRSDGGQLLRSDGGQLLRSAELSLRSAVLAYTLAGFAYALLFGIGWALQFPEGLRAWHRILELSESGAKL